MDLDKKKELLNVLKEYKKGELDENEVIISFLEKYSSQNKRFLVDTKSKKRINSPADIVPEETEIKISGKVYKLKKYTPPVKWYFMEKYPDFAQRLVSGTEEKIYAEIAYKLLEDKTDFPEIEDFYEAFQTPADSVSVVTGVQTCMGQANLAYMTETEYEQFVKEKKKET